jgi:hypothetical protein
VGAAQQNMRSGKVRANKAAFVLVSSVFFAIFERIAKIQRCAMDFRQKKIPHGVFFHKKWPKRA